MEGRPKCNIHSCSAKKDLAELQADPPVQKKSKETQCQFETRPVQQQATSSNRGPNAKDCDDVFYDCDGSAGSEICCRNRPKLAKSTDNGSNSFRGALNHLAATSQKLLRKYEDSCGQDRHNIQLRNAQLEITAKIDNQICSQMNVLQTDKYKIRVEPMVFTIPLNIQMQLPYGSSSSKMSSSISQEIFAPPVIEPIRTAIISAAVSQPSAPERSVCKCIPEPIPDPIPEPPCLEPQSEPDIDGTQLETGDDNKKPKCVCNMVEEKETVAPPEPPPKIYHLALPQHKDLKICNTCRFQPSPLIDEDGRVFCPGNCGCCLCPWKPRATESLEDRLQHKKIKVCKCRAKGTIFTNFDPNYTKCSTTSYFDICPCREKAEAKYLQMYGHEMWTTDDKLQSKFKGSAVLLAQVTEINTKPPMP